MAVAGVHLVAFELRSAATNLLAVNGGSQMTSLYPASFDANESINALDVC
jgi:hypothetical protein